MAIQDNDLFLVNREFNSFKVTARDLKIKMNNQSPDAIVKTPSIIAPEQGASDTATKIIVVSSPYKLLTGVSSHNSSDWQIIKSGGDFNSAEIESLGNLTELETWTTPSLDASTDYEIRVQYRASDGAESGWSDPIEFTTGTTTISNIDDLISRIIIQ
jgi:hypothetical protein